MKKYTLLCITLFLAFISFIFLLQINRDISQLYQMAKGSGVYRLTVKDRMGKEIYNEEYQVEPTIMTVSDDILLIIRGRGDWHVYTFINVSDGMVSEDFDDVSAWNSKMTAYAVWKDGINIIVIQDIFNKDEYYKEIKRDYSPMAVPRQIIKKAVFLDDTKLVLQYYCGDNLEIKEEAIIL